MRKSLLLIIIGITSLTIMGCSLFGFAQYQSSATEANSEENENPGGIIDADSSESSDQNSSQSQGLELESTPNPTTDPVIAAQSCVAKTWEITGLNDYIMAAIPPDLVDEYNLAYEDTNGNAYFEFSPDGTITLLAENMEILFSAQAYVFSVPVVVRIDGTADGKYDMDTQTITISDVNTSSLSASAQALGEDLIDPAQIINAVPFIQPPYNTANYGCQGDSLELEFANYPGDVPPLVFRAIE